MVGLAMMRYVVEFPAVVDADPTSWPPSSRPTLQRYLADPDGSTLRAAATPGALSGGRRPDYISSHDE